MTTGGHPPHPARGPCLPRPPRLQTVRRGRCALRARGPGRRMIRFLFRFVGLWVLAGAFVALVLD
ncbi:hypothetical protein EJV44_21125, partial [Ancylobacter aquaticus]